MEFGIWFINTIHTKPHQNWVNQDIPSVHPWKFTAETYPIEKTNHLKQNLKFRGDFKTLSPFSLVSTSNSSKNKTHPNTCHGNVKRTPPKERLGGDDFLFNLFISWRFQRGQFSSRESSKPSDIQFTCSCWRLIVVQPSTFLFRRIFRAHLGVIHKVGPYQLRMELIITITPTNGIKWPYIMEL